MRGKTNVFIIDLKRFKLVVALISAGSSFHSVGATVQKREKQSPMMVTRHEIFWVGH